MPSSARPAYWLQNASVAAVAASPNDMIVVDRDIGPGGSAVSAADLAAMVGADGARKVIAYMSTGEAESYRSYWQASWSASPPSWIGPENPEWAGNFYVRFWDAGWRDILFGGAGDYLDTLISAGFTGVWLDVVDVHQNAWIEARNPNAEADMITLVEDISRYAKALDPDFRIYVNIGSAESMLADAGFLAAIDGAYKEELFYADSEKLPPSDVQASERYLDIAVAAGKDVGLIEYLDDQASIAEVNSLAAAKGYAIYVADADMQLATLNPHLPRAAASASSVPLFAVTRGVASTQEEATAYGGPVSYLQWQFLGTGTGEAVSGSSANDFINLLAGDDAADGGAGEDVLDGGTGSNFLAGGAGRDVMFLDGRSGATIWSTITDWQAGEQLSVWGWTQGVSRASWADSDGAAGFRGATMHCDLDADGTIDTSVTWAGLARGALSTPVELSGLLWFT
jgi:uncharacterized protein (TIGR01370 family)